jgi:MoxR-like ATPase
VSPRGPINLVHASQAVAFLRGRDYVLAQDVRVVAKDVLRHRLVLSYESMAEGVDADAILDEVLGTVPAPQLELSHERAGA